LAHEHDALAVPPAEDGMGAFEVTRLHAANAGAVLSLNRFDCTAGNRRHVAILGSTRAGAAL
jgi:hypothetical protein